MIKTAKKREYLIIPSLLLGGQVVLALCEILGVHFQWLKTIQALLNESTFFLNMLMLMFLGYIVYNREQLSKVSTGIIICVLNLISINRLYRNQTWIGLRDATIDVWVKYEIRATIVFVIIVVISWMLIHILFKKKGAEEKIGDLKKKFTEDKDYNDMAESNSNNTVDLSSGDVQAANNQKEDMPMDKNYKWWFLALFAILLIIGLFVVVKYVKSANDVNDIKDVGMVLAFYVSMACLALVIIATITKYICDIFLLNRNKSVQEMLTCDSSLRVIINLCLTPIIYGIGKSGAYTESDLLEWLFSGNILPGIFACLISYAIAAIIVAIIIFAFKFSNSQTTIKKIAKKTWNDIVDICGKLISSLISLIRVCGPDFVEALISLLLEDGDEEENESSGEMQDEQKTSVDAKVEETESNDEEA